MSKNFYITSPIYYVNDIPHLGTAYCTIAADVLTRYERLRGKDVFYLTGTDEHGEKVEEAAKKNGKDPQAFTDDVSQRFRHAWQRLNVSNNAFIRTTEPAHKKTVQKYIKLAFENGQKDKEPTIYLGYYEDWYCVPDETFWTESQLKDGKCPNCGREVKKIKEENFFFNLAKFKDRLIKHIHDNPGFILPDSKKNEVLAFLKEELKPLSISRTSFTWGVEFPKLDPKQSPKHVVYVWFDALFNYVSALENSTEKGLFEKFWGNEKDPTAVHLVGKDILRFHAIYWPCFLMAVGLPLPKRIFAHGWWTSEGQKMSKSLGNVVEPISFSEQYGLDAFRLFLFREFPFGQDGDFSLKNFKERVNADLANNLGNLVNRISGILQKNFEGKIEHPKTPLIDAENFKPVQAAIEKALDDYFVSDENHDTLMETFSFHTVLNSVFQILLCLNKYVDTKAPWSLTKDASKKEELAEVLYNVIHGVRIASTMLWPFTPQLSEEVLRRLDQTPIQDIISKKLSLEKILTGNTKPGMLQAGGPLFVRLQ